MANLFSKNLKYLRESKGYNLIEMSNYTGFSRSQWNNYELGLSFPKFLDLIEIAKIFGVSETDLIHSDLTLNAQVKDKTKGKRPEEDAQAIAQPTAQLMEKSDGYILVKESLAMQAEGVEFNVYDFETPAAAGEAMTLLAADKFMYKPNLYLPGLGPGIHIRNPIKGDSMYSTIKDGDKVVATLVQEAQDVRQGYIHTILDKEEGLVCKRLYLDRKSKQMELVSDNDIYKPYKRSFNDISAIFRVREVHTWDLRPYYADIHKEMREIRAEMAEFRRIIGKK